MQVHDSEHPARAASVSELLPYFDGNAQVFRSMFSEDFAELKAGHVDAAIHFILLPGPPC